MEKKLTRPDSTKLSSADWSASTPAAGSHTCPTQPLQKKKERFNFMVILEDVVCGAVELYCITHIMHIIIYSFSPPWLLLFNGVDTIRETPISRPKQIQQHHGVRSHPSAWIWEAYGAIRWRQVLLYSEQSIILPCQLRVSVGSHDCNTHLWNTPQYTVRWWQVTEKRSDHGTSSFTCQFLCEN